MSFELASCLLTLFLLAGILYMIIIYVAGRGITWLDRKAQIN